MIKGAIFDADGTLLSSMHVWRDAAQKYLSGFGKILEDDVYFKLSTMSLEQGGVFMKEYFGLADSPETIKSNVLDNIDSFYRYEVQLKCGVGVFLENLKNENIPMIVASSGDRELLKSAFTRLGIMKYFKDVITCTEFDTNKNEPLIYLKAAELIGTDPQDTAVFEDALHAITTAKMAGFFTVAVEEEHSNADKDKIIKTADHYLTDYSDYDKFRKFALSI